MPTTLFVRNFPSRRISAILNYLHIDLAIIGLVLIAVIATAIPNNIDLVRSVKRALPVPSALAEQLAPVGDAGKPRTSLSLGMEAVLDHVAQRYRVAPEALKPIFEATQAIARERNLDPLLIIAVISIESKFNPFSQSPMGAQGLMQVIPRYHQDKLPKDAGKTAMLDPLINVQVGAQILQEAIRRQGGLMEGLQYYAGAGDDPELTYANKVIAEKLRLEQAQRRRDVAAG